MVEQLENNVRDEIKEFVKSRICYDKEMGQRLGVFTTEKEDVQKVVIIREIMEIEEV